MLSSSNNLTIIGKITCSTGKSINIAEVGSICVGPSAYPVLITGKENQDKILVTLEVSTKSSSPVTYYISTLPLRGDLYQYLDGGVLGAAITSALTPLITSNNVYYIPRLNFFGNDSFSFYGQDVIKTNIAQVSLNITFINQAPSFSQTSVKFDINEFNTSYVIDLSNLISDPDEYVSFELLFDIFPTRGIWTYNDIKTPNGTDGTRTIFFPFSNGKPFVPLKFLVDGGQASTPYFNARVRIRDSFGLVSTNSLDITAIVSCSATTDLNIWSSGAVCLYCPFGAKCSPTGLENITNAYGYFRVDANTYIPCFPEAACPSGGYEYSTGATGCDPAYTGIRCGECSDSHYRYGTSCLVCPKNQFPTWALGLIGFIILCVVLVIANQLRKMDVAFISIVTTYFQAISTFYSLKLTWPDFVLKFFGYLSVFNLNIEVVMSSLNVRLRPSVSKLQAIRLRLNLNTSLLSVSLL